MDSTLNRYRDQLRSHEASEGHNPGRLNLDGWKDVKKTEIRRLYRKGKVSVKLALQFKATMGDHVAMLEATETDTHWNKRLIELGEAGINLVRLEAQQKRNAARQDSKAKATERAKICAKARTAVTIIRANCAPLVRLTGKATAKPTLQQVLVAEALELATLRAKEKKAKAAKGKKGFSVNVSANLEAELLARNKSRIVIR